MRGYLLDRRTFKVMVLAMFFCNVFQGYASDYGSESDTARDERLQYYKDNKFGMFITFGVYSVAEGWWNGRPSEGMAEWILKKEEIPVPEYKLLAKQFNPVNFNPREIVTLAKESKMKWIVFTVKHHDGFCLFDTQTTDWDIVDATPYGRDLFKELADECHRQGIRICCLFTIGRNWIDPMIGDMQWREAGKDRREYWNNYYQGVIKGQIRELLTNYGEIGMMWFDSPVAELSEEIVAYVHSFQPNCVINGRVGGDAGDFNSTFDSTIKSVPDNYFWEYCSTISESWAYRRKDNMRYSSGRILTQYLLDVAGKNGMNLLDIAIPPDGSINPEEASRLSVVGKYMDENYEAFYGTKPNPFDISFDFGTILTAGDRVYLYFFGWPENAFILYGLINRVTRAYILKTGESLTFTSDQVPGTSLDRLRLNLPESAPDTIASVIVLELSGKAEATEGIVPQSDGTVVLEPALAKILPFTGTTGARVEDRSDGRLIGWTDKNQTLNWSEVYFADAGTYHLTLITQSDNYRHEGELPEMVNLSLSLTSDKKEIKSVPVTFYLNQGEGPCLVGNKQHVAANEHLRFEMHSAYCYPVGKLEIMSPGVYCIKLSLTEDLEMPMRFRQLRLQKQMNPCNF